MDTNVVVLAVKNIGDQLLERFRTNEIPIDANDFFKQFKEIDSEFELKLKKSLQEKFPDIAWPTSEFHRDGEKKPFMDIEQYWVADIIDGAVQFVQHIPGWTVNLTLVRNGRPIFGIVYDPLHKDLFWAYEGKGAFHFEKKINPSTKSEKLSRFSAFSHSPWANKTEGLTKKVGDKVGIILSDSAAVRNYGPTALQIAYVASGRLNYFCGLGLDTYNWLPGIVIAREVGLVLKGEKSEWEWGDSELRVFHPALF